MRRLTRRTTIQGLLAANALALVPNWARGDGRPDVRLAVVSLRGALDGLAAVPPHGDRDYRAARRGLALRGPGQAGGIIDLDGFFGLHPALAPLKQFHAAGEMIVFPAAATSYQGRLHRPGRAFLDHGGAVADAAAQGWLDRTQAELARTSESSSGILRAPEPLDAPHGSNADLIADLCHGHAGLSALLEPYGGGAQFDRFQQARATLFRRSAIEAGRALATHDGPRLALLESSGWDTHADQGSGDGRLANALGGLADGLVALAEACGDAWRHTAVLVVTEFGRSVGMNAMGGTDHGFASAAFLLGGAVAGGRIVGGWPGLAADRLHHGRDLVPTTDLHAIVKAVLSDHLGLSRDAVERSVLSGSAMLPAQAGLFRA